MAIGAATNWYVRTDGNELNGGGFDSTISGAGTNYCDQGSPQLSLTDIVTNGTTTVTSSTGGFTSAMIGNCLRIAGDGYYFVTARGSSTSITVDRATGTGSGQSGRIGGAFASILNFATGGVNTQPLLASPVQPGNNINIRGSGSSDPSTLDYTWTGGYWTVTNGSASAPITVYGYNGRPFIGHDGLMLFINSCWRFVNVKFQPQNANTASTGNASCFSAALLYGCIFDQNGFDIPGVFIQSVACFNEFRNTGSTSVGTSGNSAMYSSGAVVTGYTVKIFGNYIHGWRAEGWCSYSSTGTIVDLQNNIIYNCKQGGIRLQGTTYIGSVVGNTVDSCSGDGCYLDTLDSPFSLIQNNIFSNNGGYGLNCAAADYNAGAKDYNNYYNNTSGARNNSTAGAHDTALNPQYNNASGGDFTPTNQSLKYVGSPGLYPGSTSTSYVWPGAVQPQGASSGPGPTLILQRPGIEIH